MIGIIVASHGPMAAGVVETSQWFFGEQPQLEALCLQPGQDLEEFDRQIREAAERVDTGDGVLVLCDLLFGTPCNRAALQISEKIQVLAGMNLGVLLELLGSREYYEGSLKELTAQSVDTARKAIDDVGALLEGRDPEYF